MKAEDTHMYTCGIDDSVKEIDLTLNKYTGAEVRLGAQPRGMDVKEGFVVAASVKEVRYNINNKM